MDELRLLRGVNEVKLNESSHVGINAKAISQTGLTAKQRGKEFHKLFITSGIVSVSYGYDAAQTGPER